MELAKVPKLFSCKKDIFFKNLYFNIKLRTAAFQKVACFVPTIKTNREMTITLKKSQKIAKNKKIAFFQWACDFTVGK